MLTYLWFQKPAVAIGPPVGLSAAGEAHCRDFWQIPTLRHRLVVARTRRGRPCHSLDAVLKLGQRRRRWTNIEAALGECLVFAGCVLARICHIHIPPYSCPHNSYTRRHRCGSVVLSGCTCI